MARAGGPEGELKELGGEHQATRERFRSMGVDPEVADRLFLSFSDFGFYEDGGFWVESEKAEDGRTTRVEFLSAEKQLVVKVGKGSSGKMDEVIKISGFDFIEVKPNAPVKRVSRDLVFASAFRERREEGEKANIIFVWLDATGKFGLWAKKFDAPKPILFPGRW